MGKIFKAIGKGIKSISKFVKKNWKTIVIAAAVVFTAGLATVGFAGFAGAMSAAGGGFGGFMSAAGSTLWAGAGAIGGSLGIGPGAQGAAAAAAGVEGASLGGGVLAAKLGSETAAAGIKAQLAGMVPGTSSFIGPSAALAGSTPTTIPTLSAGATQATKQAAARSITRNVAAPIVKGSFMDTLGGQALVTGGIGAIQGYFSGKALEDRLPLAAFGQNIDGSRPSFVLPGQINPDSGKPFTEEESRQYNERMRMGAVSA